jgi:diacylglycerol O-acyltransferase / wax synthase
MSQLSRRLSAHDSVFLHWERPEQPMHVAECMVYDGHITAEEMVRMVRERIHLLPRYRQKVVPAPFGIAHPTWEDDATFDVADHVDERSLPSPGDDRALSRTCGELFCGLLDRDRPLWHLTVLHGYDKGGTVVFLKLHHSMVDGVSSVELIEVLHSAVPGAAPPAPPRKDWEPQPVPGLADRLRDVLADQLTTNLGAAREAIDVLRPGGVTSLAGRAAKLARATLDLGPMMVRPLPPTPFNKTIHAKRDFAWVELDQVEVKEIRTALGGTVNDLVLGVLSGALARYMRRHGAPTAGRTLNAMCPVSVRRTDKSGAMGNLISMVVVPLHVGIDDGDERLRAEHASMKELKRRGQAEGIYEVIDGMKWLPAPIMKTVWKRWPKGYFPMHITSTNVPGPATPLFLGEHELLHWYPFGVQWTNNALFMCTLSYRGRLVLAPVSDPEIVPDIWEFAADLRAAYDEIRRAAGVGGSERPRASRRPARKRSARKAGPNAGQVRLVTSGS